MQLFLLLEVFRNFFVTAPGAPGSLVEGGQVGRQKLCVRVLSAPVIPKDLLFCIALKLFQNCSFLERVRHTLENLPTLLVRVRIPTMATSSYIDYEAEGVDSTNTDSSDWSGGSVSDLDNTVHMGYYKRGPSHVPNKRPLSLWSGKNNVGRIPDPTYTMQLPASVKVRTCGIFLGPGCPCKGGIVGGCGQLPGVFFTNSAFSRVFLAGKQFLGMNLDMNRVYGYKVINVKGAAERVGVEGKRVFFTPCREGP